MRSLSLRVPWCLFCFCYWMFASLDKGTVAGECRPSQTLEAPPWDPSAPHTSVWLLGRDRGVVAEDPPQEAERQHAWTEAPSPRVCAIIPSYITYKNKWKCGSIKNFLVATIECPHLGVCGGGGGWGEVMSWVVSCVTPLVADSGSWPWAGDSWKINQDRRGLSLGRSVFVYSNE